MRALLSGDLRDPEKARAIAAMAGSIYSSTPFLQKYFPYHVVLTERARLDLVRMLNLAPERVVVIHHSMPVHTFVRNEDAGKLNHYVLWCSAYARACDDLSAAQFPRHNVSVQHLPCACMKWDCRKKDGFSRARLAGACNRGSLEQG